MKYQHTFTVKAPLETVAAFHRNSSSMAAITPPPVIVRIHQAPEILKDGDEMAFTLWLGPLPIHWLARIEQASATGFVDRQLRGPFTQWVHTHSFRALDPTTTEVHDQVEVILGPNPLWKVVGLGMWLNLPILFAFRGWKTRQLLENQGKVSSMPLSTPPAT